MEITKKDRVFLINQYEILKRLDPGNASSYDEKIEILTDGYEVFYSSIDEWISEDMPASEGKLVLDVLDIYSLIQIYKRDNPEDSEVGNHSWSSFRGFDGNNETEYMAFTRFLIDRQGKFSEQAPRKDKTDNFNSHTPVVDKYHSMVQAWRSMPGKYALSREQILTILNA